ncbi:predicted protein [Verticillium alfalfae VaMs.102]|uniref:Predicted protein n=1 Tax=Verticillium alfalfae (strain VaMs.102 / ATCC MYA-4576 / FGSC 10136) TaxID=526221 RepID=C9SL47_VERA1|nr:predicted protein [Verticillium alfalfae VaMs.102]EEY19415.1 predicted protein [Verticillium alfalfae VaMs.102]
MERWETDRAGSFQCDGQTPCARCSSRGLECEYQARIHRSKRSLRDEIEVLKQRQREQDALLEALQDPLRRDAALHMLQERSRAAAVLNDSELGQQQTDMPIKQEERRHSDVSSWNNFDDMRASSGSPLQGFTSSSTTRAMVSTTPQMSWTTTGPSMRPDTSVTSGMETGAFQAPATTARIRWSARSFRPQWERLRAVSLQHHKCMAVIQVALRPPLPFRMQNNDWNKEAASSQLSSQPWMGPSPGMVGHVPLQQQQQQGKGAYHVGGVYHPSWEKGPDFSGAPMHGPLDGMEWTQGPGFTPVTNPSTSSFPPNLTTRPASPVNSRTNSSSTTASSGTTQSSAPSMTSATPSVGGLPFSPSMKPPPPVSFFEPVDESGRRQSMPDCSTVTADAAPIECADARERHRIASARSWSKQKSAIADLQATVSRVEAQHATLRQEYTQVLNQVHDVHNALLKHVGCNDPAISMWLKQDQEASTAGMSREKPGPLRPVTNEFVAEFSHDAF